MAKTPNPKSVEQLLGEMLADYASKTGVSDFNPSSLVVQLFETVALATARTSGDAFQILRDLGIDSSEGEPLKRIAKDEGLKEIPARVATGTVTIKDTNFNKISTKIYAGSRAPNVGSTKIFVSDASEFSATGQIYIGRGTPNIEGPILYSSVNNLGSFWEINLLSPTAKFHNTNESVIMAQGGVRTINSGSVVSAPGTGANPDINFITTQDAIILDGETEVKNVPVSAQEPGTTGNVPIGAIRIFSSPPFSGAQVTNELPFKTGRDVETDEQLRVRIKRARLSRGLGTALAVKNSVVGAAPSDENSTITASEIIVSGGETTLYIDDNTGYEQKTTGVGVEFIVDSALGGETNFQLQTGGKQTSLAKAFVVSTLSGPFDVKEGDRLAVSVGGVVTEHQFLNSDFISPGGAIAYEIVASINSNSNLLFEATTSDGATKVLLRAKQNDNEDIQVVDVTAGRNVRELLGFPSNRIETLKLFKNKKPLSKDGNKAIIKTNKQSDWANSIVNGDNLILSVDGTSFISYVIEDSDFVAEGSHPTVAQTNSLQSWVNVLNSKLTGATAYVVGEQIFIESNLGFSNRAKLEIAAISSLVNKNMFEASELISTGKASDYELSRNTAQIKLNMPLSEEDELTAGTFDTEARIESDRILGGTVSLPSDAEIWAVADDKNAFVVNTALTPNSILEIEKPLSNIIRYRSNLATAFASAQIGDYVIVWSQEVDASNRIEGRVVNFDSDYIDVKVTASEFASSVLESGILYNRGIVLVRTTNVPQRLKVLAGTKLLVDIADELQSQTKSLSVLTADDEILIFKTKTKSQNGSVLIVTTNVSGLNLNLPVNVNSVSQDSLIANKSTSYEKAQTPIFKHGSFTSETFANPNDSFVGPVTGDLDLSDEDPSLYLGFLQPYNQPKDVLQINEKPEVLDISGFNLSLLDNSLVKRIRSSDRFYLANPLDFNANDSFSVILDGDQANKTFGIPLFRKAETNSTLALNSNSFNAFDSDVSPSVSFLEYFNGFDFTNFKVMMRAKRVLDQSSAEDAILFRATSWGKSGERIKIGYSYPTTPNSDILHSLVFDENANLKISLKSGAVVPTSIDGTTEWDVTIVPNFPVAGKDQVTYTWTGSGTAPALGALVGEEYATISLGSELDPKNLGTFKLSQEVGFTPTANSFTVVMKNGQAVAQQNVSTVISSVFSFFETNDTTAQEIADYVNSTLQDLVTAEIVDDGGTSGSGVISLSTDEYLNFSNSSLSLLDGINWIESSDMSASPQFFFKRNLSYISDVGYAFNEGEELRLVPTSLDQVERFVNNLAVSGLANLAKIVTVESENKLDISTNLLGGNGSVQVVGGPASKSSTPVIGSSVSFENYMSAQLDSSALAGFSGGQLVKVTAKNKQAKSILAVSSNLVTITPDSLNNKSIVEIDQKQEKQNLFGRPKTHVSLSGRNFKVEKQGSFTCVSWDKNGSSPEFSKQSEFLNEPGEIEILKNADGTATIYVYGTFLSFLELKVGDYVQIENRENPENNGSFLVVGVSEKELIIFNPNAINELSTASFTIIDNTEISGDEFQVNTNAAYVFVAGVDFPVGVTEEETALNLSTVLNTIPEIEAKAVGTTVQIQSLEIGQPAFTVFYNNVIGSPGATDDGGFYTRTFVAGDISSELKIEEGDLVKMGSAFAASNQGSYRIVRVFEDSFYIENKNSVEEEVTLGSSLVSDFTFDNTTELNTQFVNGALKVEWSGNGTEPLFSGLRPGDRVTFGSDFHPDNQGTFPVIAGGDNHSFVVLNPLALAELGITISDVLFAERDPMSFYPYDAVNPEDTLVITSNVLGEQNRGNWPVLEALSDTKLVVSGVMAPIAITALGGQVDNFLIEEKAPYVGYKKIKYILANPNLSELANIAFDSRFQASKINEAANVSIESLNRLDFSTSLIKGTDSYVYHTGLIGEANRIVYGDPRDSVTYPGVAAAGAEIFIREPLIRRVKMTIDVRLETGIPFGLIVEQVRTTITSLVNGNELGRSIAISDIIENVNTIPGVRAVAISSPLYDVNNDIIVIQPTEKSKIIDPVADVGVRRIGN